jgi:hypothetical protein
MDGWMDEWIDGLMDGRIDGLHIELNPVGVSYE